MEEAFEVVVQCHERPFDAHFDQPAQAESPEAPISHSRTPVENLPCRVLHSRSGIQPQKSTPPLKTPPLTRILAGSIAAFFTAQLPAQTTITYTNGQNNTTLYNSPVHNRAE